MRYSLILLQVLFFLIFYVIAGFIGSMFVVPGGGSASTLFYMVLEGLALIIGTGALPLTIGVPLLIVTVSTCCCAILSGYRFFRWTRWVGFFINVAGGVYFMSAASSLGIGWLAGFCLVNMVLLACMPRKPDIPALRQGAVFVQYICMGVPVAAMLAAIMRDAAAMTDPTLWLSCVAIFCVYAIPLALHIRQIKRATLQGDGKQCVWTLLLSGIFIGIYTVLFAPLGALVLWGWFGVLLFFEALYLFPSVSPSEGTVRYMLVRFFGRLPDTQGQHSKKEDMPSQSEAALE